MGRWTNAKSASQVSERELVFDSVTSTPQRIRQPRSRDVAERELANSCSRTSKTTPRYRVYANSISGIYWTRVRHHNVTGFKCEGVLIGTPEFVKAFVRSNALDIDQDVQSSALSRTPKIIMTCCAFVNKRILHFSPARCLLNVIIQLLTFMSLAQELGRIRRRICTLVFGMCSL
jgi:hypothetical protein